MRHLLLAGVLLGATALAGATVPRPAPPLNFMTANGQTVNLAALKGKVVVVEIMSTTCPHCQTSARVLSKLKNELGPKGLEVLGYAINDDANVLDFMRQYGPNLLIGKGNRDTAYGFLQISLMQQFYFPQVVFIDRTGTIRAQYGGTDSFLTVNEEVNIRGMVDKLLTEGTAPAKKTPAPKKKAS